MLHIIIMFHKHYHVSIGFMGTRDYVAFHVSINDGQRFLSHPQENDYFHVCVHGATNL